MEIISFMCLFYALVSRMSLRLRARTTTSTTKFQFIIHQAGTIKSNLSDERRPSRKMEKWKLNSSELNFDGSPVPFRHRSRQKVLPFFFYPILKFPFCGFCLFFLCSSFFLPLINRAQKAFKD